MRTRALIVALLTALSTLGSPVTGSSVFELAAQTPVSVSTELSYRSTYLWAGIPFAAGNVTQANVSVASGGLTLNVFSVLDHEISGIMEGDVYGDYYRQLSSTVGAFVGAGLYRFKIEDAWDATFELYGGVALAAPLNPTLYIAHDFDLGEGTHALLTLSHGVPISEGGLSFNVAGNVDYNVNYYREGNGFSVADVILSLGVPLGPVTVTPMVQLQRAIADDFTDEEVFGVTASFTPVP